MPITQPRMVSLVNAAQDFCQAAEFILNTISNESRNVELGRLTAEQALQNLKNLRLRFILKNSEKSYTTIAVEAEHFRKNARRNVRAAERKAEQRLGAERRVQSYGVGQSPNQPDDLYETSKPETGGILEEPVQPSSRDIYSKVAEAVKKLPAGPVKDDFNPDFDDDFVGGIDGTLAETGEKE